jgi:hypothetical protein
MGAESGTPTSNLSPQVPAMFTPSVAARVIALALVLSATSAAAQEISSPNRGWGLRIPSGALIATGSQRDHLEDAQLTAIQLSRSIGSRLAITGTFAWARSRDLGTTNTPKLDVFTSDMGVEASSREFFTDRRVSLSTFAGLGAGARSYNYRKLDLDATNNLAGYAAAGGEVGVGRVAIRVEARDYATGFKPLAGAGKSEARNDVVIMAGIRFNRRPAEER